MTDNGLTKSFQPVNKKIEVIIYSQFVQKKSRNNTNKKKYFVATTTSFYLCTYLKIIRSLTTTHHHPWVDLRKLTVGPQTVTFDFQTATIQLHVDEPEKMIEPLIKHWQAMFAKAVPVCLSTGAYVVEPAEPGLFQFDNLYGSYCYSMVIPVSESLVTGIRAIQKHPLMNVNLVQLLSGEHKSIPAVYSALHFAVNIHSLTVSGTGFQGFWRWLTGIVISNAELETLVIDKCDDFDGFAQFTAVLPRKNLNSLHFISMKFDRVSIGVLSECMKDYNLSILKFTKCPFDEAIVQQLLSSAENYSRLSTLAVTETDFMQTEGKKNDLFKSFFEFLFASRVPQIELVDDHLDIVDVYEALDQSTCQIMSLNLSNNICTANFTGHYVLPVTLTNFKLANVEWHGTSLVTLLTTQRYMNPVTLDVSAQRGNKLTTMHSLRMKEVATNNIKGLLWDSNSLSEGFFKYLVSFDKLEKLSINYCTSIADESQNGTIMNYMVMFLQNTHLKYFSIRGSADSPYQDIARELFAVIGAHQTLEYIDVSGNCIGDSGFDLFVDCLARNSHITTAKFDGSKLTNSEKFIKNCNRLAEMTHLINVEKPRKDMEELIKREREMRCKEPGVAIEAAWKKVKTEVKSHKAAVENLIASQDGDAEVVVQNASWDIDVIVKYNRDTTRWDELGSIFSLSAMTHIRPEEREVPDLIEL